jgi:hypothetical protein
VLRSVGVRGLELVDDGDRLTLVMEPAELVEGLNNTSEDLDLSQALADLVDAIDGAVASAAGWDAPAAPTAQVIRLDEVPATRFAADQSQTSLLYAKSSLQSESEAVATKPAVKAYGRK